MSYIDFEKNMKAVFQTEYVSTTEMVARLTNTVEELTSITGRMIGCIERQNERIRELQERTDELQHNIDLVYCDLAPDIELIDEIANGDERVREELLEQYRNNHDDVISDAYYEHLVRTGVVPK